MTVLGYSPVCTWPQVHKTENVKYSLRVEQRNIQSYIFFVSKNSPLQLKETPKYPQKIMLTQYAGES